MLKSILGCILGISVANCIEIQTSCRGLDDGDNWLKLTDTGHVVRATCSNEYAIIDVNQDSNWQDYFSSWATYHYAIAGPDGMEFVNWEGWFKPDKQRAYNYVLSPDCHKCEFKNHELQKYGEHSAYYMTSTMFGCPNRYKSFRDCSWNWNTYECVYCTKDISDADLTYHIITEDESVDDFEDVSTGLCGVLPHPSYTEHYTRNYDQCWMFTAPEKLKPSIGTDGRFCVCVQPTEMPDVTSFTVEGQEYANIQEEYYKTVSEKAAAEESKLEKKVEGDQQDSNIVYLYQKDFEHGTYRIKDSGTYIVMEDIEFNFNEGDINNPNDYNSDSWWPNESQQDVYPGSYQTRDEYFMGFWAGITIESDDVTLDLGGYEVRMSKAFYYQQRFFACVALKSVAFSLNQGPGIWGANPIFPARVTVKNGIIGLSSHHGIHGQGNRGVVLEDLHIKHFETHGIELTDFADVVMNNVEVGPASTTAYLTGEYTYARFTLQRMWRIYNDPTKFTGKDNFPITFANRKESLAFMDIFNKLHQQMDMAFQYAMGARDQDPNDANWIQSKKLFIREDGIPYGATMYGIMLNLYYANVFHVHPSLHHSQRATLTNVEIHDLKHNTQEYIRLDKFNAPQYKNPYNSAMNVRSLLGENSELDKGLDDMDWSKATYIGDTLTDAHIAMTFSTNDWGELQLIMMDDDFLQWTLGKHTYIMDDYGKHPQIGCNNDRMTHLAKGVMGIRMDGVEQINYNNLNIHDLYEYGGKGSDLCGEYWANSDTFLTQAIGGHFLQRAPYALGYTGNMVHGIYADWSSMVFNDVQMQDLYSNTGLVRGVGAYSSTEIKLKGDGISFNKLASGISYLDTDTSIFKHPHAHTKAKPFHIVFEYDFTSGDGYNKFYSSVDTLDKSKNVNDLIKMSCIYGRDGQLDDLTLPDSFSCDNDEFNKLYNANNILASNSDTKIESKSANNYVVMPLSIALTVLILSLIIYCCKNYGNEKYKMYKPLLQHESEYGSTTN